MSKVLIVVDMQKDFVDGSLGTLEAVGIVSLVKKKIKKCMSAGDDIIFTVDTHYENYLDTREGENLPVKHCIKGTEGWNIIDELVNYIYENNVKVVEKNAFGSIELPGLVEHYDEIELIGLCTDICVISNAILLKTYYPEKIIEVDASCCAGTTQQSHENALAAMKMCQIKVLREAHMDKWHY